MGLLHLFAACAESPGGTWALTFSEAPDCARLDTAGAAAPADFTVEAWVRAENEAQQHPLMSWNGVFALGEDAEETLYFHIGEDYGASFGEGVMDGVLHHLAGTYAAADGEAQIYIDGQVKAQATGVVLDDVAGEVQVGCDPEAVESWSGLVDEIRISSVNRYPEDFALPEAAFEPDGDTLALFHLDEGAGEVLGADGGDWTGTLTEAGWVEFSIEGEK